MPGSDLLTGLSITFSIVMTTDKHLVEVVPGQPLWHRVHDVGNLTRSSPPAGHRLGFCPDTSLSGDQLVGMFPTFYSVLCWLQR